MKKHLLICTILFLVFSGAKAQDRGQFWLAGTFSVWASKDNNDLKTTNLRITPEVGYQFHRNWGIGIQAGYVKSEDAVKYFYPYDYGYNFIFRTESKGYIISPYIRYSFLNTRICNLFTDISFAYSHMKVKNRDVSTNSYEAGLRPGVSFRFHPKLAFVGRVGFIGYEGHRYKNDGVKSESNSGGIDLDLSQIQLGLIFTL